MSIYRFLSYNDGDILIFIDGEQYKIYCHIDGMIVIKIPVEEQHMKAGTEYFYSIYYFIYLFTYLSFSFFIFLFLFSLFFFSFSFLYLFISFLIF